VTIYTEAGSRNKGSGLENAIVTRAMLAYRGEEGDRLHGRRVPGCQRKRDGAAHAVSHDVELAHPAVR